MTPIIRPATRSDFPQIRALIRAVFINPTGLDWRRFIIAVTPQGELIGCGQVKTHRDGSRELASIAVAPDWRSQGIARTIIERLLEDHPGPLYLTCRARLKPLYKRFGFETIDVGEMEPYFRRISKLVSVLGWLGLLQEDVLVMKRKT